MDVFSFLETTAEISITFACPTDGDSTCDSLVQVSSTDGEFPGIYSVEAVGSDAGGDAVTYELVPFIEKTFRGIGEGWARVLYGGSTGGWISAALQM